MNHVIVQKVREPNQLGPLLGGTLDLLENVRKRAFELFQRRGGADGGDLTDWLQAESEIFQVPRVELAESDGEFQLRVAVPGFDAKDIRVAALPNAIVVQGETAHQHSHTHRNVRVCEFGERRLFRRIPLPEPVDIDHTSATVDKGMLEIRLGKADQHANRKVAA